MTKIAPPLALLLLCLTAAPAFAKTPRRPVVVELFTSQGCGACTRANALIADLADRKDVLALTFPVDYWDYLGWKDTFARPEFSARQRLYMRAAGQRDVYTPQVVVDGEAQPDKSSAEATPALITAAAKTQEPGPDMRLAHGRLTVTAGRPPENGADVWLVRYDSQPQETPVRDGENRGVTVVYRNVAVELDRLGAWSGRARTYAVPQPTKGDGSRTVVLLQVRGSGRILAVLRP